MSNLSAFAFEQLVISDKTQVLTPSIFKDATEAYITCEGTCRFRYDGGDVSETEGHLLRDGASLILRGDLHIKRFSCIGIGEPCVLSISYER